jgi:hypothetical protein
MTSSAGACASLLHGEWETLMKAAEKSYADGDRAAALKGFLEADKLCQSGAQIPSECADTYLKLARVLESTQPEKAKIYYRKVLSLQTQDSMRLYTDRMNIMAEARAGLTNLCVQSDELKPLLNDLSTSYFILRKQSKFRDLPEEGDYTSGCLSLRIEIFKLSRTPEYIEFQKRFLLELIASYSADPYPDMSNPAVWDFHLRLGTVYLQSGDYLKAEEQFRMILMHEEPRTFELVSTIAIDAADSLLTALKKQKKDEEFARVSAALAYQMQKCGGEKQLREICGLIRPIRNAFRDGRFQKAADLLAAKQAVFNDLWVQHGTQLSPFFTEASRYIFIGAAKPQNEQRLELAKAFSYSIPNNSRWRLLMVNDSSYLYVNDLDSKEFSRLHGTINFHDFEKTEKPKPEIFEQYRKLVPVLKEQLRRVALTENTIHVGLAGLEGELSLKAGNLPAAKSYFSKQLSLDNHGLSCGAWDGWSAPGQLETYPDYSRLLETNPKSLDYLAVQERLQNVYSSHGCGGASISPAAKEVITGPVGATLSVSNPNPSIGEEIKIKLKANNIHFYKAEFRVVSSRGNPMDIKLETPPKVMNSGGASSYECTMNIVTKPPVTEFFVVADVLPLVGKEPLAVAKIKISPRLPVVSFSPPVATAKEGDLVTVVVTVSNVDDTWMFSWEQCNLDGNCFKLHEPQYHDGKRTMEFVIHTPAPAPEYKKLDLTVGAKRELTEDFSPATFTLNLLPKS